MWRRPASLHTHAHTHSDCVSLGGPDGPTRSVKHPSDLCVKSVTRGHLFWTQQLAAPSQHNSSNGYVGDRGGWWGAAEEEEAAAATGQFEMRKQPMIQGTREHHRSSKPQAVFEDLSRLTGLTLLGCFAAGWGKENRSRGFVSHRVRHPSTTSEFYDKVGTARLSRDLPILNSLFYYFTSELSRNCRTSGSFNRMGCFTVLSRYLINTQKMASWLPVRRLL